MKINRKNRIISAILCLAMVFQLLPIISFFTLSAAADASNDGMKEVVTTEKETHDGIDYELTRRTRYIGNRTYSPQCWQP